MTLLFLFAACACVAFVAADPSMSIDINASDILDHDQELGGDLHVEQPADDQAHPATPPDAHFSEDERALFNAAAKDDVATVSRLLSQGLKFRDLKV